MVSIITISYNTEKLLKECLSSVYTNLKGDFEVIVVDNDSKDDSVAMIKKSFPKVTVIETHENLGFGKGCNRGGEVAKGDVLLFLNSDAEVLDNSIFEMEKFLLSKENAGVAGGLLQSHDGSPQLSKSTFYNLPQVFKLLFFSLGNDKAELSRLNTHDIQEVDWVSGGFMMVKKSVYEKVGGFDKNIFMYIEDMELCYQIRKVGYSVWFYPHSRVKHLGQGSSNRTFAIVQIYKGLTYFYKKHKSMPEYMLLKFLLLLKAYLVIIIGTVLFKKDLVDRYKNALSF